MISGVERRAEMKLVTASRAALRGIANVQGRRFSSTASKQVTTEKKYETYEEILQDAGVKRLLEQKDLTTESNIDNSTTLALLRHLSQKYSIPVASNGYREMGSAKDIAKWFSQELRPCGARPHARDLIVNMLGKGVATEVLEERIDLERETVQEELTSKLPSNLSLDEKTFLKPGKVKVKKW